MKFSELGDNGPQFKLDELTGWTQAAPKRATPQPKKPTYAELIKKSDDKRSALQRQKDGGKKNWFAEEELEEASWINGVKQDDKELVWKQTSMSYEKAVEQYGKEHVKLGGKNKLGQQTVQVHVPLVAEGQYQSQYKSKEDAIAYAKDKAKTFRDPEDGIEIWSMPDGGFDAVHTMNSNGRNHCVANGGKKLGTIGPRQQGVAEGDLDEASLAQMRDYFGKDNADSVQVNRNYDTPSRKKNPAGIPPEIQTLVNKMYHAGKITPQEFEVLRKFQRQTKINVGIREADANPYAIGMSQAMKSTGDKPPLKKSTINKAHAIARSIKKGE